MSLQYHRDVDPKAVNNAHAKLARMAGGNKRVLELGCHAGDVSRALCEAGCEVWGVEVDPEAAELARNICHKVIVADLDSADPATLFGGERFDVVMAGDVIEHLADPPAALSMMKSLLAPGGHVLVSVPNIAHVSARLLLLGGKFPHDPVGLLDHTHRRFFTRDTLERALAEAGLEVILWDRVSVPFSKERIKEELALIGVSADPGLLALLSAPDASTYQYVVKAAPLRAERPLARLILICPEGMPPADRVRAWVAAMDQAANGSADVILAVNSADLDRAGLPEAAGKAELGAVTFSDPLTIGVELNQAAARSLADFTILAADSIMPDASAIAAMIEACRNAPSGVFGHHALVKPPPGSGDEWWEKNAVPPARQKDVPLEYCQGFNLCFQGARRPGLAFAEDLPWPWVLVEWLARIREREYVFAPADGAAFRCDFSPRVGNMARAYEAYGAMLAEIEEARPGLVERSLPEPLSMSRKLRQAPRGLSARFAPGLLHAKYFERMRADMLARGYARKRSGQ